MVQKKSTKYYVIVAVGFVLFVTGIVLVIIFSEPQGIMKSLPFICLGIGSGLCSGGLGGAISSRQLQKNPQLAKEKEINTKDERNITISNKAKAAAYNFTLVIFSVLIMFLALVQVETYITLVFTGVYLLIISIFIYFLNKYHKEM